MARVGAGARVTGDDFKVRRTTLGLSQGGLARAFEVPVNTVARWERGELVIRHAAIMALAFEALETRAKKKRRRTA